MNDRMTAQEISAHLAADTEALTAHLLPEARRDGQHLRVGSLAGEKGQSLCINLTGRHRGSWRDFTTGQHGDALDLIAQVRCNGDLKEAIRWARSWLGEDRPPPPPGDRTRSPADDDAGNPEKMEWARKIWGECVPAAGTLAEVYLRSRGLTLEIPPTLRFHPCRKHAPSGLFFPTMIAAVQNVAGEIVGIHRTFLMADGRGKARVTKPKRSLGPIRGAAVRLAEPGPELVLSEGIESGASVQQQTGLPAWACLSTSGLMAVVVPASVRSIIIAADHDKEQERPDGTRYRPGDAAAQAAGRRFIAEGRKARIARPPIEGTDFNDLLQLPGNVSMFPRKETAHV